MPLPDMPMKHDRQCLFATIGPAREEWGEDIHAFVVAFWTRRVHFHHTMQPRLKFEVGDKKGYNHFHLGVYLARPTKWQSFLNALKKHMRKYQNEKPPGYNRSKGFSICFFAVPCSQTINSRILRGADLINHYLDNPTKQKCTDGGNWQLHLAGFSVSHFAEHFRAGEEKEAMLKYAQKYLNFEEKHGKLPPLDEMYGPGMLLNRPTLRPNLVVRYQLNPCNPEHPKFSQDHYDQCLARSQSTTEKWLATDF